MARLEAGVEHIDREVIGIRADFGREITGLRSELEGARRDMRAQFLWLVSAMFAIVLLGIAAVAWANTKFEVANERMTRLRSSWRGSRRRPTSAWRDWMNECRGSRIV